MLTFKLNNKLTNIQLKFATAEKSPIFTSHKSYKNSLLKIADLNKKAEKVL